MLAKLNVGQMGKTCEKLTVSRQRRDQVLAGGEQYHALFPLETVNYCLRVPTQGMLWKSLLQLSVIPGKVFSVDPSHGTHHLEPHYSHQLKH